MTTLPEAIVFDCDGTLLLTADLHFEAIAAATAAQGAPMARDWYMGMTGLGRHDLFARFAESRGAAAVLAPLDPQRLAEESIDQTLRRAAMARPNPPVAALARRCAGRVPIAVATNSERRVVHALLGATGLLEIFDTVVSLDDVSQPKPAPEMFLLAARRLGVAPGGCLVLEDSAQGLRAAQAAGMAALDVRQADTVAELAQIFALPG